MADTVVGLGRGTTHPYLHYRNSGVDWLGEVPEHWDVKRLSLIGSFFKGGGGTKEDEVEDGVPCVRYGDIYTQYQYFIRETRSDIREESAAKYTQIHYGDILFAGSGETLEEIGKSAADLIEGPAYCGGDVIILRPVIECDANFLGYAADCSTSIYQKACMGRGVTVMHIYGQELKRLLLPLPPIDEQRAIGAFLDQETERFDSLVLKIRLLIERLGEYRTALITRTVTRGLPAEAARLASVDPSPRLKPLGMECLGEVPEHWEVKRLKYLLRVPLQYGANEPSNLIDPESPRYIRITDIREDGMLWDETLRSIPQEVAEPYLLSEGDLLFARSGATVGKTFKYLPSWGKAAYAGYLVRARLNGHLAESNFVEYYTHSQAYKGWILGNLIQSTIQNVSAERYASLAVPLPPIDEQRAIATFLDRETERIDSLAAKMRLLIERLGEYRTALITAAVTGKIDVRTSAESPDAHLRSRLP